MALPADQDRFIFTEWPADEFPPFTPFWPIPIVVAFYLASIYGLQAWMKNRDEIKLPKLLALHNFILTIMSFVLAAGSGYEAVRMILTHGWFAAYCGSFEDDVDIRMARWCVAFYLSKYYELLDTYFLVLRKRKLIFLHVYHHAIVIPVCWMAVDAQIYMGWITSFNNAAIHVPMYLYYALSAMGYRPTWNRFITSGQLLQFIIDMSSSVPFYYIYFHTDYRCRGEVYAWYIANCVGFSFLLLFANYFFQTYIRKRPHQRVQKDTDEKNAATSTAAKKSAVKKVD
jgi:fatty acid elongase 3